MIKKMDSKKARAKRHARVRSKISGTPERPRLSVYSVAASCQTASCYPMIRAGSDYCYDNRP